MTSAPVVKETPTPTNLLMSLAKQQTMQPTQLIASLTQRLTSDQLTKGPNVVYQDPLRAMAMQDGTPDLSHLKDVMIRTLNDENHPRSDASKTIDDETARRTLARLLKRQDAGILLVTKHPERWARFQVKLERKGFFKGAEPGSDEHGRRMRRAVSGFANSFARGYKQVAN